MLDPLVDAGYTVTVVVPDDAVDLLGWRVMLNAPDRHASFLIPTSADPAVWDEAVALILRRAN